MKQVNMEGKVSKIYARGNMNKNAKNEGQRPLVQQGVYRVALCNCSPAESCGACLAQRDPFCGWCVTEGTCTHKSACSSSHWLSYRASPSSCPQLTSIKPPSTDINQSGSSSSRAALTLQLIPALLEAFSSGINWPMQASSSRSRSILCTFRHGNSSNDVEPSWRIREKLYAKSEASLIPGSNDATCSIPSNSDLQVLGAKEEYTDIDIWLEVVEPSSESILHPLASGKFLIYDCGKFTTCKSCLGPSFDCVWHLVEDRCLSHVSSSSSSVLSPLANSNSFVFCAKSVSYFQLHQSINQLGRVARCQNLPEGQETAGFALAGFKIDRTFDQNSSKTI
ncbi:hypothetical protein ACTXT7_010386 [Hymenolepis weldensis]